MCRLVLKQLRAADKYLCDTPFISSPAELQCPVLLRESINSLKRKYSQSSEPTESDAAIDKTLGGVAKDGCQFLLDEVFLDLEVRTAVAVPLGPCWSVHV